MSYLSARARVELAILALATALSVAFFTAEANAATNIPTKCDWANSFKGFFYGIAGEVKGLAYVLGPATIVILVVTLIFMFRSNSRGGLFAWIFVILIGLFALGIVGTLTGAISTGGC
jgi:hypothetical protein